MFAHLKDGGSRYYLTKQGLRVIILYRDVLSFKKKRESRNTPL